MAEYNKLPQRFVFSGISVFPPDLQPAGKLPYARNIRSYAEGQIQPRAGLTRVINSLGSPVLTLARLNDPTPFNGGVPAVRIVGAGTGLYRGTVGNASPGLIDSGYSGNPLTYCTAQPPQSPRPYAYIADSNRYRKFTTDGSVLQVGLAQPSAPSTEPLAQVGALLQSAYDIFSSTSWIAAGTAATPGASIQRVDTTISQIVYDVGNTGYCSIVPADFANITVGMLCTVGNPAGSFDNAIITDITIAIASTTVESIIYDSGSSGLCTIQPAGSLGTGQLEAPAIDSYRRRAYEAAGTSFAVPRGTAGTPPAPDPSKPFRSIRQVDFPVNCIIQLGGEVVRVLSVAIGPDGIQSFRCSTAGTISAGTAISGYSAFRLYLPSPHSPGEQLTRPALENTLTYGAPVDADSTTSLVGGIQGVWAMSLAQFANGQAVLPEDELHVAVNINRLTEVTSVRVYIDVDATTNDFLQNYYFYEWRASDIITAIQGTNAASVAPLIQARQTVVANQQLESSAGTAQRRAPSGPGTGATRALAGGPGYYSGLAYRNSQLGTSTVTSAAQRQRQPTAASATSTQLGLGNNQWIDLRVKIGTLQRVGTDPSRNLSNAQAFEVLVSATAPGPGITPEPLTVKYSDLQIYGGSGPDIGEVGDPYVYAYRYRSSLTGAVSNPSPANRGGVMPRRQPVDLTPTPSSDPQVDKIDWFRLGGGLTAWTYVSTGNNSSSPFSDTLLDSAIDGGETIRYDQFQPWPVQDITHTGTCNVAGSAIEWTGGDLFDTGWAPGSVILVNGRATTLYSSPGSTTKAFLADSIGSGSGVAFALPGPTLLSQPLAQVWGDYQGFYFACGDALNPGTLYGTHGNNIEATSDAFSLIVTSPSEPLQAGGIYNTFGFVFSSEQLYAILLQPGNATPFRTIRTPCGRGLWSPWAWDVAPEGIYFLGPDGIYLTAGGSPAEAVSNPDLRAIFPHDGIAGQSVNGIPVPDMTQTTRLRLSYIGGWLYFDYLDTDGTARTLIYDTLGKRWMLDDSALTGVTVRLEEPGAGVYDQIVGGANGAAYQYSSAVLTDDGTAITYQVSTPWIDGGSPRLEKQWGDLAVDMNLSGGSMSATAVFNDAATSVALGTIGPSTGRASNVLALSNQIARNMGLVLTGTVAVGLPTLFWWEPSFLAKGDDTGTRPTDWENLGYQGAKFVQGVIIRANTYGAAKTVQIQKDGGAVAITLSITHDGETQVAYPLASVGWDPFVTELIRIVGVGTTPWQLLDYRFVWEPAPELATQWETQFTSHDLPGYMSVHDMVIAHESTSPLVLTMTVDDRVITQVIPASGGSYKRDYLLLCPNKGKAVKYQVKTDEPARLYVRDLAVRVQGWGIPGGYMVKSPFGGPSRSAGAEI